MNPSDIEEIIDKYEKENGNMTRLIYRIIKVLDKNVDIDSIVFWILECHELSGRGKNTGGSIQERILDLVRQGLDIEGSLETLIKTKFIKFYKINDKVFYKICR